MIVQKTVKRRFWKPHFHKVGIIMAPSKCNTICIELTGFIFYWFGAWVKYTRPTGKAFKFVKDATAGDVVPAGNIVVYSAMDFLPREYEPCMEFPVGFKWSKQ